MHTGGWRKKSYFKKAITISEAEVTRLGSVVRTSTHWGMEILIARWATTFKLVPRIGIRKQDSKRGKRIWWWGMKGEELESMWEYEECPWSRTWVMRKAGAQVIHMPCLMFRLEVVITQGAIQNSWRALGQKSNRGKGHRV